MRISFTLLLLVATFVLGFAQPSNDDCTNAINLNLSSPSPCPSTVPSVDVFSHTNVDATPITPYPTFTGCNSGSTTGPAAEVWFTFVASANIIDITVTGLSQPNIVLFSGTNCDFLSGIDCSSGNGSTSLNDIGVLVGNTYYLLVSGNDVNDTGTFNLEIGSSNNCNPCNLGSNFSSSPPPQNGTYASGQTVNFCFTVERWNTTGTIEWLHAVTFDIGPGWDLSSLVPTPPPSCDGNGRWDWYDSWTSSQTGLTFGPGFAYDSGSGGPFDGNPGNNWGDGGGSCANIGTSSPPKVFCFSITAANCPPNTTGNNLNVSANIHSDGESGSWSQQGCNTQQEPFPFLSSVICCDDLDPIAVSLPATCPGECDGQITVTGGGGDPFSGPFNFTIFDGSNNIVATSIASSGPTNFPDLCPGTYSVLATNTATGCNRSTSVTIADGLPPDANASNTSPACPGEPVTLMGSTTTPGSTIAYEWTGPGGFTSNQQNPTVTVEGTYTLIITVDGCPSDPVTTEVEYQTPFVTAEVDDDQVCEGDAVTLTATGGVSYDWGAAGTGSPLTVVVTTPTTFTVTVTDGNGCTNTADVFVDVFPLPEPTITPTGSFCVGEFVVLFASGGDTFAWSDGQSGNPIAVELVGPVDTYTVTVTDVNGCMGEESITINVFDAPTATITSSDPIICQDESTTLTASGGNSYAWSTNQPGASITVSPGLTTTYTVTVTDPAGCEAETDFTVEVQSPPPAPVITCENATNTSVEFFWTELPGIDYTIEILSLQSGSPFTGSIFFGGLAPGEMVTIRVTASLPSGECPVASTTLTCSSIACIPVTIAIDPVADICLNGANGTTDLNATVTGNTGGGTETWEGPGIINAANGIFDPANAGTGAHEISFIYTEGICADTATITINVFDTPTSAFTVSNGNICLDENSTITYTGTASAGATYNWNFDGGTATPGTGPGPHTVEWTTAGTKNITLTVTENGCTSTQTTQTVTVDQPLATPVISCTATTSSVEFSWAAIPGASSYNINVGTGQTGTLNGTTYTVTGLAPGELVTITVEAVSSNSCSNTTATFDCNALDCPTVTVTIDPVSDICLDASATTITLNANVTGGAGGGTGTWSGNGITNANTGAFDPNAAGVGSHTITYEYSEGTCDYSGTITIVVNAQPTSTFTTTFPICITGSSTITYTGNAGTGANYTWNFNGGTATPGTGPGPHTVEWATAGTKTITLTVEENGCTSELFTATVEVENEIAAPTITCTQTTSSVEFSWNDVPGATSYNVNITSGQPFNQNGTTVTVDNLNPGESVTISVEAINGGVCANTTATLTCNALDCPDVNITIDSVDPICLDGSASEITLVANTFGGAGTGTGTWSGNGITNGTAGTFDPTVAGAGTTTVTYTYVEGNCDYTETLDIVINAQPDASFNTVSPICIDGSSTITYTGGADPGATYIWNFDGGTATPGTGPGPHTVEWTTAGSKTITLTVEENGCTSEAVTQTVQVDGVLPDPVINCATTTTSIEFSWMDVPGATSYNVTVLSGPTGTQTGNSYLITGLTPGQQVEIEVEAVGTGACGNSTNTLTCTAEDCPDVTIIIDPVDDICLTNTVGTTSLTATISGGAGGGTSTWSGPGITDATNGTFDPTDAGVGAHVITLNYQEANCTYNESLTINVFAVPTADFTVSSPICIDGTSNIVYAGSGGAGATYIWNFDGGTATPGTGPGPHTVEWTTPGSKNISLIVEENGCTSEEFSETVQVDDLLPDPVINCNTNTTSIEFTWDDVPGATSYNVTVLAGATGTQNGNSYVVTGLNPGDQVTIQVEAVGTGACGNSMSEQTCTAEDCPAVAITIDPVDAICLDNIAAPINLNAEVTGGAGGGTLTWSGDGIIDGDAGTFDPLISGVGEHVITANYQEANCTYNETITVSVLEQPTATFTVDDPICLDATSTIIYTGTGSTNATFIWNFDGGMATPGTGSGPHEVSWTTPGMKTISLTVEENGCTSEVVTQMVQVDDILPDPVINCNSNTTSVEFVWNSIPGATSYNVTVLSGPTGTANDTTYLVTGLNPGDEVTIQVEAVGDGACGNSTAEASCVAQNCPDIAITIDQPADVCLDANTGTINLTATVTPDSGTGVLTWSGNGIVDGDQGTFDPTLAGPGVIIVTATYTDVGCTYNETVSINVFDTPTAEFTASSPICQDDASTIAYTGTASNNATFTWNFGDGVANPGTGAGPHDVTWATAGMKTITLTVEENGCVSAQFEQTIMVQPTLVAPTINCTTTNTSIEFTWEEVEGASGYTVEPAGGFTGVLNGTSYVVDNLSPGDEVTITVTAQSAGECPDVVATATCTAVDCPTFVWDTDTDIEVCADEASFNLVATVAGGVGGGTLAWTGDGITGINTDEFSPALVGPGTFTVVATYTEGVCTSSQPVTVTVLPIPTATFDVVSPICVDGSSTLTYTGTASANATYNWELDGGTIVTGAGQGPIEVSWDTSGTKTVSLIVDENGCISEPVEQTIEVEPTLEAPVIICDGTSTSITFSWEPIDGATEYIVTDAGNMISNGTNTTYEVTGLDPDQEYTIEVTAVSGTSCSNSTATQTCLASACPSIAASISGPDEICIDDVANLIIDIQSASSGPFEVIYTINNGEPVSVTVPLGATEIGVELQETASITLVSVNNTSLNNCMFNLTESIDVLVSEPSSPGISGDPAQVCAQADTLLTLEDIVVSIPPGGEWTASTNVPAGAFNATNGTFQVQNVSAGSYTFTYQADNGGVCPSGTVDAIVIVEESPSVDAGSDQTLSCNMGMVSIGGNNTSIGSGFSYNWTSNDPGAIIADPNAPFTEVSQPGTYILEVTNEIGCSATDEMIVESEFDVPVAEVSISEISCFNENDGAILVDGVTGGKGPYQFSLNGAPFSNQQNFIGLGPDSYTLNITDQNGCNSELLIDLTEPSEVLVNLVAILDTDNVIQLGDSVQLRALYNPEINLDTIIWEPDTLRQTNESFVWVNPETTSTYSVTIIDKNGCSDSDQLTIFVEKNRQVYIPNAFSPDGDGTNDVFYIQSGPQVQEIKNFKVFNRWGEPVIELSNFQPNDPALGWDGTYRGEEMNAAVFVFFVEIEFVDGDVEIFEGDVVLMK